MSGHPAFAKRDGKEEETMGGYDLSEMDLQELKQVDVRTVNPDTDRKSVV